MSRKFKVGDIIYSENDADIRGLDNTDLFTVVAIGEMNYANGFYKPFVTVKSNIGLDPAPWGTYEDGWALYNPLPPTSGATNAGAQEYEEIMQGLDLVKIKS